MEFCVPLCIFFNYTKTTGRIDLKFGEPVIYNSGHIYPTSAYIYPEIPISFSNEAIIKTCKHKYYTIRNTLNAWFKHIMMYSGQR